MSETVSINEDHNNRSFEVICGIVLSLFAGVLALANLGGTNADIDALKASADKTSAYEWYNTKGIKAELSEGASQTLLSLLDAGAISREHADQVKVRIRALQEDTKRYRKEAQEILEGSEQVGKANWAQDIEGKFGQVVGAKVFQIHSAKMSEIGDIFDLSALFLQLCLIMGALSIVLQTRRVKWSFFTLMVIMGLIGLYYCISGYMTLGA